MSQSKLSDSDQMVQDVAARAVKVAVNAWKEGTAAEVNSRPLHVSHGNVAIAILAAEIVKHLRPVS